MRSKPKDFPKICALNNTMFQLVPVDVLEYFIMFLQVFYLEGLERSLKATLILKNSFVPLRVSLVPLGDIIKDWCRLV